MLNFLFTLMMKSVDFETRECSRDGGSASPTSHGVEMITHLDVDTALKCCQMKYDCKTWCLCELLNYSSSAYFALVII